MWSDLQRFFSFFIIALALFSSSAYAITEKCGDGIDNDGVGGDLLCPAPDQDNDDYAANGTGRLSGTDCDDTNRYIYPGITTAVGCAAGQVHTCQSSGVYTSCIALSSYVPSSGSGQTLWISPTGGTLAGCGSFGVPCDYRCISNPALGCFHALNAGDAAVFRGGVYNTTWLDGTVNRMVYISFRNGAVSHPIRIMGAPGELAEIVSPGIRPTYIRPFFLDGGSRFLIQNLSIHDGFGNDGISLDGVPNVEIRNNTVYNIDAAGGSDNSTGIKVSPGSDNVYIHHNLVYDNYDRLDLTTQNTAQITLFNSNTFRVENNVGYTTPTNGTGYFIKVKHGYIGGTGNKILSNFGFNFYQDGIATGSPDTEIAYNRIYDVNKQNSGTGISSKEIGGPIEFKDLNIHHNLIINASAIEINPDDSCGSSCHPLGAHILDYTDNIVYDNRASYGSDGVNGFIRVNNYGSNTLYTAVVTGNKLTFDRNCYYNTLSTPLLFDLFANIPAGNLGQNYIGLPAWMTAGFGYDATSVNANPLLDIYDIPTFAGCIGKGWRPQAVPVSWGKMNKRLTRGHR